MDETTLIAVIAASSAILGGAVPAAISLWAAKGQRTFEIKKYLLEHQQTSYFSLLETLQAIFNDQQNHNLFRNLQIAVTRVAMYGEKEAADEASRYYLAMVSQSPGQRQPLTEEEHKRHQFRLINAMRNGLGLEQVEDFGIVSFLPNHTGQTRA